MTKPCVILQDSKKKSHAKFQGTFLYKRTADFNYWKKTVKEYTNKEDEDRLEKERPKRDTQLWVTPGARQCHVMFILHMYIDFYLVALFHPNNGYHGTL